MNARYQGPAVFPPASETRKRVEAHLDALPAWDDKQPARSTPKRKKWASKLRRLRRSR